jgi:hypothetical protein
LLFCRLVWSDFGELVWVMEHNPGCSMDTLLELCESWFWWKIGVELLGEWGKVEKTYIYIYIYMKLAEVKGAEFCEGADFWHGDEAKFLVFMIIRKCGVDFWNWIVIN